MMGNSQPLMLGKRGFLFQLGELHGKALGTAFQKEHSSLRRRFLFVRSSCSHSDWAAGVQQLVNSARTSSDFRYLRILETVNADACCCCDLGSKLGDDRCCSLLPSDMTEALQASQAL